jgi:hypothetical protein
MPAMSDAASVYVPCVWIPAMGPSAAPRLNANEPARSLASDLSNGTFVFASAPRNSTSIRFPVRVTRTLSVALRPRLTPSSASSAASIVACVASYAIGAVNWIAPLRSRIARRNVLPIPVTPLLTAFSVIRCTSFAVPDAAILSSTFASPNPSALLKLSVNLNVFVVPSQMNCSVPVGRPSACSNFVISVCMLEKLRSSKSTSPSLSLSGRSRSPLRNSGSSTFFLNTVA